MNSAFLLTSATSLASTSLTLGKAIVLGVVEGLTEFLPVSSTGHLLIAERWMKVGQSASEKTAMDTFTVVIQIGAILAVLGIYRQRFVLMIESVTKKSVPGRNLLLALAVAFVPAAILGKVFDHKIKDHLLKPWPVVAAWLVGGVVILYSSKMWKRPETRISRIDQITWRPALIIGVAQALALWPGVSRSLVTILAALAVGCSIGVAVEFSFLLGFFTLSAATAYELMKNGSTLTDTFGLRNPLIATIVAGIAAFLSVKWMVKWLTRKDMTVFGWYRIGAAVLTAVLLLTKAI